MIGRIRTIKPEFFKHGDLFDAEVETGLPLRLAFAGIWCLCDREGRFVWKPREMKLDVLPHDDVDFSRVLDALATRGFLVKYASGGKVYGWVPSFTTHQVINNRESKSIIPAFEPELALETDASSTREARVSHATTTPLKGKGREGKGTEGKGTERFITRHDDVSVLEPSEDSLPTPTPPEEEDSLRLPVTGSPEKEQEATPWFEDGVSETRELREVAMRLAATRIRSKDNPFPYRKVTPKAAARILKALEPCPTKRDLDLFWQNWGNYHARRTKPYDRPEQTIENWARKEEPTWERLKRHEEAVARNSRGAHDNIPTWTPGGAA